MFRWNPAKVVGILLKTMTESFSRFEASWEGTVILEFYTSHSESSLLFRFYRELRHLLEPSEQDSDSVLAQSPFIVGSHLALYIYHLGVVYIHEDDNAKRTNPLVSHGKYQEGNT